MTLDWKQENVDLRGYKSAIEVRNKSNDLPNEAVDALLSVCEDNHGLFQRFFQVKKRVLGLDQMHRYDIYAPINLKEEDLISYGDAVDLVMVCLICISCSVCFYFLFISCLFLVYLI